MTQHETPNSFFQPIRRITKEKSGKRNPGEEIMEQVFGKAFGKHLGSIWEAFGRHLRSIWEHMGGIRRSIWQERLRQENSWRSDMSL